jgi:DNA replication protein DnaC
MQSALALLPGLFNGGMVILAGPIGSGKTFAACVLGVIVCNFCEGDDWIRLEGKFVQSHAILKAAFDNVDYATDPFLIVDDMGREHFTDKGFGISEWDRFFDARYADMMPTIVTTNLTETEFEEKYNRRILDRLKECAEWIVFSGQSLRGRGA